MILKRAPTIAVRRTIADKQNNKFPFTLEEKKKMVAQPSGVRILEVLYGQHARQKHRNRNTVDAFHTNHTCLLIIPFQAHTQSV